MLLSGQTQRSAHHSKLVHTVILAVIGLFVVLPRDVDAVLRERAVQTYPRANAYNSRGGQLRKQTNSSLHVVCPVTESAGFKSNTLHI